MEISFSFNLISLFFCNNHNQKFKQESHTINNRLQLTIPQSILSLNVQSPIKHITNMNIIDTTQYAYNSGSLY